MELLKKNFNVRLLSCLECCWHFPILAKTLDGFASALKALRLWGPNRNIFWNIYRKFHKEAIRYKSRLSARLYSSSSQLFMVCGPPSRDSLIPMAPCSAINFKLNIKHKIINLLLLHKSVIKHPVAS